MIIEVQGRPGIHVSSDGRVFSSKRKLKGMMFRELIQSVRKGNRGGYPDVKINNKIYRVPVHQLVLEGFRGRPSKGMEARHLDGNPENNEIDNLVWGTRAENQRDRHRHGRCSCGDLNGRYLDGRTKRRRPPCPGAQ